MVTEQLNVAYRECSRDNFGPRSITFNDLILRPSWWSWPDVRKQKDYGEIINVLVKTDLSHNQVTRLWHPKQKFTRDERGWKKKKKVPLPVTKTYWSKLILYEFQCSWLIYKKNTLLLLLEPLAYNWRKRRYWYRLSDKFENIEPLMSNRIVIQAIKAVCMNVGTLNPIARRPSPSSIVLIIGHKPRPRSKSGHLANIRAPPPPIYVFGALSYHIPRLDLSFGTERSVSTVPSAMGYLPPSLHRKTEFSLQCRSRSTTSRKTSEQPFAFQGQEVTLDIHDYSSP